MIRADANTPHLSSLSAQTEEVKRKKMLLLQNSTSKIQELGLDHRETSEKSQNTKGKRRNTGRQIATRIRKKEDILLLYQAPAMPKIAAKNFTCSENRLCLSGGR
jgi:hypothetical protein